jgi:hypothetical protein
MRTVHRLGLSGTTLPQVDGKKNDGADGKELTLPVLEGLKPKSRGAQVFKGGDTFVAMAQLVLTIESGSGKSMERE